MKYVDEGDSSDISKKRNRLSFVCQGCRKAKTKCDKEKPACSRCLKHGIRCVYDLTSQKAPKNPNKDAMIARLEKELSYWKKKTLKLTKTLPPVSRHLISTNEPAMDIELSSLRANCTNVEVNLFKVHPRLIVSGVIKREVNPLSENYLIIQDKFTTTAIASVFLNYQGSALLSALASDMSITKTSTNVQNNISIIKENLLKQCRNDLQGKRIKLFVNKLAQNMEPPPDLFQKGKEAKNFLTSLDNSFVEDYCPKGAPYSELLQSLIDSIESLLPPYDIIIAYKKWYYDNVYYIAPFVHKSIFEDDLAQILVRDDKDPQKVKVVFGNSKLRSKLETMSMLLLVMKLAYTSIILTDDDIRKYSSVLTMDIVRKYPISSEVAHVVQNCLSAENWCATPNENIISCLLLLWAFFVFSPDEGDFFYEQPTGVLASIAMMLGVSIGLHKDPSDYPVFSNDTLGDKRVCNQRRLLWIAMICVLTFETNTKGSTVDKHDDLFDIFIDLRDPSSVYELMDRVKKDCDHNDEGSIEVMNVIENLFRRTQTSYALYDLNALLLSPDGRFTLSEYEILSSKVHIMSKEYIDLVSSYSPKHGPSGDKAKLPLFYMLNCCDVLSGIIFQLMNLRISIALFLHFEERLVTEENVKNHYIYFFTKLCLDLIALGNTMEKFFDGTFDAVIAKASDFIIKKAIQVAINTVLFGLLAVIMRFDLAASILFNELQSLQTQGVYKEQIYSEMNSKIQLLNDMKVIFETQLKNIYHVCSTSLRFEYFTIFKMLTLFDALLDRIEKNELWIGILRMAHLDNVDPKIAKVLAITLRIQLIRKTGLVEDMQLRSHLAHFELEKITKLHKSMSNYKSRLNLINTYNVDLESTPESSLEPLIPMKEEPLVVIKEETVTPNFSNRTVSPNLPRIKSEEPVEIMATPATGLTQLSNAALLSSQPLSIPVLPIQSQQPASQSNSGNQGPVNENMPTAFPILGSTNQQNQMINNNGVANVNLNNTEEPLADFFGISATLGVLDFEFLLGNQFQ